MTPYFPYEWTYDYHYCPIQESFTLEKILLSSEFLWFMRFKFMSHIIWSSSYAVRGTSTCHFARVSLRQTLTSSHRPLFYSLKKHCFAKKPHFAKKTLISRKKRVQFYQVPLFWRSDVSTKWRIFGCWKEMVLVASGRIGVVRLWQRDVSKRCFIGEVTLLIYKVLKSFSEATCCP